MPSADPRPSETPGSAQFRTTWQHAHELLGAQARLGAWQLRVRRAGSAVWHELADAAEIEISNKSYGAIRSTYVLAVGAPTGIPDDDALDIGESAGNTLNQHWQQFTHEEGPLLPDGSRKEGAVCIPWFIAELPSGPAIFVGMAKTPRPMLAPVGEVAPWIAELPRGFAIPGDLTVTATAAREQEEEVPLPTTWQLRPRDDAPTMSVRRHVLGSINANTAWFGTNISVVEREFVREDKRPLRLSDLAELAGFNNGGRPEPRPAHLVNLRLLFNRMQSSTQPTCGISAAALWIWYGWLQQNHLELGVPPQALSLL